MSIYEKAKELGNEIANSPELRRVKESELKIMIDINAREIVEEYQGIQAEAINSGLNYEDFPKDKKERLQQLEELMNENEIITEYLSASQELNQILESVNMIISNSLNGNESSCGTCGSGSCSSGCSCGH